MLAFLDRFFSLKENNTSVKRELLAGATTFVTMAYALIVIPSILSQTGMDFGSVLVATALAGVYSTFMMGVLANYPFILAPGLPLCVYFTYSVVLGAGRSWQTTLGIVFLMGVILLLLNLFQIRQLLMQVIPTSLRLATIAGMGIFLALIGLRNAGIITDNPHTLLAFAPPNSVGHIVTAAGLIAMGTMMALGVPGAIFLGMLFIWVLSLTFGWVKFEGIVSSPPSLMPTFFQLDVSSAFEAKNLSILISFLFIGLFDSTGTLVGLADEGGFLEDEEVKAKVQVNKPSSNRYTFPRVSRAIMPDTTGTLLSPMLGSTPVAVYLESIAGMSLGGRTGLTALTASFLFLVTLFVTPFAASIPLFATTPALIIVGSMMIRAISRLNWGDATEWIPACTTLILIPLSYSIAVGIAVGYITYCLLKLLSAKLHEVHWFSWIVGIFFILKFIFFPKT